MSSHLEISLPRTRQDRAGSSAGLLHSCQQLLFIVLSLADLALTCWLLGNSNGQIYEANPLARWWLLQFGAAGLACFKVAVVLAVLGLVAVIGRVRPVAAGRILGLACAVLLLVVLYSLGLCRTALLSRPEPKTVGEINQELDRTLNSDTRANWPRRQQYRAVLANIREDLIAGRTTLRAAARRLARTEQAQDPTWRRHLGNAFNRPHEECLAVSIMVHVTTSLQEQPQTAWQMAHRLERQFQLGYGSAVPHEHRRDLPQADFYASEDSSEASCAR